MKKTLRELKDWSLDLADMTGSDFIVDSQLTQWVNSEVSELHDLLVAAFADYFHGVYKFDPDTGIDTYALPSDFYKMTALWYVDGNARYHKLRHYHRQLYHQRHDRTGVDQNEYLYYHLLGNNLKLSSAPNKPGGHFELWYTPAAQELASDGDILEMHIPFAWHEFIVNGVAARCLAKEESDPSIFLMKKAEMKNHLEGLALDRNTGDPEGMQDVYERFEWYLN